MNIQQFNKRFNELVTEEVHHLRDNLTTEQKKKLKVGIMNWGESCVYQQIFLDFEGDEAMSLKTPTVDKAESELKLDLCREGLGVMEFYLFLIEKYLPKKQWQAAKSRLVNVIKGKTTEPLMLFNATAEQINNEFQLVSPLRAK